MESCEACHMAVSVVKVHHVEPSEAVRALAGCIQDIGSFRKLYFEITPALRPSSDSSLISQTSRSHLRACLGHRQHFQSTVDISSMDSGSDKTPTTNIRECGKMYAYFPKIMR